MKKMDIGIDQKFEYIRQEILAVSARVRTLESAIADFRVNISDCESSCQGVSNLFSIKLRKNIKNAELQIKTNTRTLIHQDTRIKEIER